MKRARFMYAAGMFIGGMYFTSILYFLVNGPNSGNPHLTTVIWQIAVAYVVVAAFFNHKDRQRNKS